MLTTSKYSFNETELECKDEIYSLDKSLLNKSIKQDLFKEITVLVNVCG